MVGFAFRLPTFLRKAETTDTVDKQLKCFDDAPAQQEHHDALGKAPTNN